MQKRTISIKINIFFLKNPTYFSDRRCIETKKSSSFSFCSNRVLVIYATTNGIVNAISVKLFFKK